MNRLALAVAFTLIVWLGALQSPAAVVGFDDAATWWRFDDDLTDSNAPPASDGSVQSGTVTYTDAIDAGNQSNGRAAVFNGDRVLVTAGGGNELDTDTYTNGLTVFARIDPDDLGHIGSRCVVNRDGYSTQERVYTLEVGRNGTSNRISWRAWSSGSDNAIDYTESNLFPESGFCDVVGVFRPGEATEVYVDGELWRSRAVAVGDTTLVPGGTVPVAVGNRGLTNYPYYGDLESAAVWNQALAPGDIKRLTTGPMDQNDAKAWLRFGGDYSDSNTPPASDGTPHGGIGIVSNPPSDPPFGMNNGQVARFDGVDDYIDLGLGGDDELDIDGSNGFTVFARVNSLNKSSTILGRDGFTYSAPSNADRGFVFSHYGSSGPHFRVFNGTDENTASYSTSGYPADYFGDWHDLVGVFRPGEAVELWMDGVLVDSTPTSFMSINTPAGIPITIGRSDSTGSGLWYFRGDIESVAFWDHDLTPGEIRNLAAPEPTAFLLAAFGMLGLLAGRRRRTPTQ